MEWATVWRCTCDGEWFVFLVHAPQICSDRWYEIYCSFSVFTRRVHSREWERGREWIDRLKTYVIVHVHDPPPSHLRLIASAQQSYHEQGLPEVIKNVRCADMARCEQNACIALGEHREAIKIGFTSPKRALKTRCWDTLEIVFAHISGGGLRTRRFVGFYYQRFMHFIYQNNW